MYYPVKVFRSGEMVDIIGDGCKSINQAMDVVHQNGYTVIPYRTHDVKYKDELGLYWAVEVV